MTSLKHRICHVNYFNSNYYNFLFSSNMIIMQMMQFYVINIHRFTFKWYSLQHQDQYGQQYWNMSLLTVILVRITVDLEPILRTIDACWEHTIDRTLFHHKAHIHIFINTLRANTEYPWAWGSQCLEETGENLHRHQENMWNSTQTLNRVQLCIQDVDKQKQHPWPQWVWWCLTD